jgi:hypothetical protein
MLACYMPFFGSIYANPFNLYQTNIIKNPTHQHESHKM